MLTRLLLALTLASLLSACAHSIVITPPETLGGSDSSVILKKVAYVMTDTDRNKEVSTEGGGGDKVSYFPYRDLEKPIRSALRAVYSDVIAIKSNTDLIGIQENGISFIYAPEITTSSSSNSILTWPPTKFTIDLSFNVTDPVGNTITRLKVVSEGAAEFSDFKTDPGLAGKRAATELSRKLKQEISDNPRLH